MKKQLYLSLETDNYELNYYLLEDESGYGIQIDKMSNQTVAETKPIYDLCTEKDEVCEFIHKIKDGSVTPVTLEYVVEDWIAER